MLRLALPFPLEPAESRTLRDGVLSGERKNAGFDPRRERLKGVAADSALHAALWCACARYQRPTVTLAGRGFRAMRRSPRALAALRVTKTVRNPYDHRMPHIHDRMKLDADYQRCAPREDVHFAAGETWIVFSEQASHAALAGRFVFERTFHLPVGAQRCPERSPLRVLERLSRRALL